MRVCVSTLATYSYKSLSDITLPILRKYCEKHGYSLSVVIAEEGKVDFIKTADAIRLLDFYDLCFMIEADVMIMNFRHKIEDFIDDTHDLFICKDINGVNFGTAIIKGTKSGKDLMNFIQSKQGEYQTEQNVLENYTDERICYLNQPAINQIPYDLYYAPSYGKLNYKEGQVVDKPTHEQGCWEVGDFCMHLPGMTLERRIEIFQNHLKDIIYE